MKHRLLGLLLFLTFNVLASNENYYQFSHIDNVKGIISNQISTFLHDSNGFIWIGTPHGLSRWDGYSFRNFSTATDSIFLSDRINSLYENEKGEIIIRIINDYITYNPESDCFTKGISNFNKNVPINYLLIDKDKNTFIISTDTLYYKLKNGSLWNKQSIPCEKNDAAIAIQGGQGIYWILFQSGRLIQFDMQSNAYVKEKRDLSDKYKSDYEFYHYVDNDGDVWIYSLNPALGLWLYQTHTDTWEYFGQNTTISLVNEINNVTQADDGRIWIGTDHGGIFIYDKLRKTIRNVVHNPEDPRSLCQNSITAIYKDNNGIMWIGTFKKGVDYYHKSIFKFTRMSNRETAAFPALPFEDINCFTEDKKGNVWIGTNGGGLICYTPTTNEIKVFKHNPLNKATIGSDIIVSLYFDKQDRLWICTWLGGLNCLENGRFIRFMNDPDDPNSLPVNSVWNTLEDSKGNFWVTTFKGGIYRYEGNGKFTSLSKIFNQDMSENFTTRLIQIRENELLASTSNGVYSLNLATKKITELHDLGYNLSNNNATSLYQDSRRLIWIGTENGLNIIDRRIDTIYKFNQSNGLPNSIIRAVIEDENHNIWVSTLKGLACVTVQTKPNGEYIFSFEIFNTGDGLQSDEFNPNAVLRRRNNELYFGGPSGISIFKADDIAYNTIMPHPLFTDFQLSGKSIAPGENIKKHIILSKSIFKTKEISLPYNERDFTISFSALSYLQPQKIKYSYRLLGFNDNWLNADVRTHQATYTNLNPGDYTFEVIASNSDGVWNTNPVSIHIQIKPPFYLSIPAYIFYFILFIGCILIVIIQFRRKLRRDANKQRIRSEHEMDEMKLRFFTNISHEFRTPISLILSPCESMLKERHTPEDIERLHIIVRNANNLLSLVNKLLDFRKLDKNAHTLNAQVGNIIPIIQETCRSFGEMATKRSIVYTFTSNTDEFFMEFDEDKIQKIIMNLLSNAFKFTPQNGSIKVNVDVQENNNNHTLIIKVSDTGIGIKADDVEHIFDRFYQAHLPNGITNHGSGVGLNLVKEFVSLHHGSISVESTEKQGCTFTVSIPAGKAAISNLESMVLSLNEEDSEVQDIVINNKDKRPYILIVDDNDDFRLFISHELQDKYNIIPATDGKTALEIATNEMPDVIVSDVMMPEMDGLEFCHAIRSDNRTSHIPIILLTAKATEEDCKKGFELGVDYYITKPFNMDMLKLHIQKLIERSSHIKSQISQQLHDGFLEVKTSEVNVRSLDEKLIEKAVSIVEERMDNSNFSVEELSRELSMSRVHLYKKLISITGKSPIEFVRLIRLRHAAQLLEKSQLSVAEIAYQVGFNNPKYFSRYFKEEFGVLPSEYAKKQQSSRSDFQLK